MGLRQWLAGRAVRATRVLVVEAPDGFAVRVAVERATRDRGWSAADSPASADALVVAGHAGDELSAVVAGVWDAMPGPRARIEVLTVEAVGGALDDLARTLLDHGEQVLDAAGRGAPDLTSGDGPVGHEGSDHGDMDHGDMDHGDMDHGDMAHGDMAHGDMDHGDMDHGDMDMAPDGIPLAEGSDEDRDGLEMDALPVRLGPVLPHWPPGMVLDVTLHGDLVVAAEAHLLDGPHPSRAEAPAALAALRCDEAASVLALAGWDDGAALARRARDSLLDPRGDDARGTLVDLRHRVEHARVLRWSLRGVGSVASDEAAARNLPEHVVGDCFDRLLRLVDEAVVAARAYAGTGTSTGPADGLGVPRVPVEALGGLVEGCDLGVARLVVASLGAPAPAPDAELVRA